MSGRHTSATTASVVLAGVLAFGVVGCTRSTEDRIVGKWVTGQGATAGRMEFSKTGMLTQNLNPPVTYEIVGDNVVIVANGQREVAGRIDWVSDDRFRYTVLNSGCQGLVLTYERVQ